MELYQFQNEFRELSNKFSENEKIIKKLIVTGANIEEVREKSLKKENHKWRWTLEKWREGAKLLRKSKPKWHKKRRSLIVYSKYMSFLEPIYFDHSHEDKYSIWNQSSDLEQTRPFGLWRYFYCWEKFRIWWFIQYNVCVCTMLILRSMFLAIFIESDVAIWHIHTVITFVFVFKSKLKPENKRWTSNWTKWTEWWKLSLWMSSRPKNLSTLEKMWDCAFLINIIVIFDIIIVAVVIIIIITNTIMKQHWKRCEITSSSSPPSSKLLSSDIFSSKSSAGHDPARVY